MYTFSFICMPFRSMGIGNITSVVTVKTYVYSIVCNSVTNLLIISVYRCKECLSTKSGRLKQSNVQLHPNVTLHPSVNWKSPTQRKFQLSVIKSDE